MNQSKNHAAKGALLFIVISTVISFLFQNCSKTDFSARDIDVIHEASVDTNSAGGGGSSGGTVDLSRYVSAKSAGVIDDNCQNNNQYDACIFWKNPVAQKGAAFQSVLTFGTDLSALQKFGVQLKNLKSPQYLESNSLYVYISKDQALTTDATVIKTMPRLSLNNGQYRLAYNQDGDANSGPKATAQLMAYFWLNHMIQDFSNRVGSAYSNLQKITYVDAFANQSGDLRVKNNAYYTYRYSGNQIVSQFIFMGYASKATCPNSICHEMALSAEVYLHEMGHADLYNAAGPQAMLSDGGNQQYLVQISKCTMETSATNDDSKWLGYKFLKKADVRNEGNISPLIR